jgi:hypothetical protein
VWIALDPAQQFRSLRDRREKRNRPARNHSTPATHVQPLYALGFMAVKRLEIELALAKSRLETLNKLVLMSEIEEIRTGLRN